MTVWYHVRDLDTGRAFYRDTLGFTETDFDADGRWARLERAGMEIGLAAGEPSDGGVAHVEVDDLKAETERLRGAGVDVGIVVEVPGELRLVDVYDLDGNRVQFAQELRSDTPG